LAEALDTSPANASRHLAMLHQQGLVERESRGSSVVCRIADPSVFELCELVCGTLARRLDKLQEQRSALGPAALALPRKPVRSASTARR
jgi:DNA-binding transcriptional ArsR family regulator